MTKIYKLLDPDTLEVRYVGKTIQTLNKRLSGHITKAKNSRSSHVCCWIYSLLIQNKKPLIELIEEVEQWQSREQYWISLYPNLCNHSIGGESGTLGYKMTQEHKDKISNSLINIPRPLNVRQKISNSHKGKILRESTKDKLRQANLGKVQSIDTIMKKSKIIIQYDVNGNFLDEWISLGMIEKSTGFLKANISSCCHGRLKTAYGYKWSFKNEDIVQT